MKLGIPARRFAIGGVLALILTFGVYTVVAFGASDSAPETVSAVAASGDATPKQAISTLVAEKPCELNAVPDLAGLDPRSAEVAKTSPFSQVAKPSARVSRAEVVASAKLRSSGSAAEVAQASTKVASVPFELAARWFETDNPIIADNRCVWVVEVQAPFQQVRSIDNRFIPPHSIYSVMVDQASGEGIGLLAGGAVINGAKIRN